MDTYNSGNCGYHDQDIHLAEKTKNSKYHCFCSFLHLHKQQPTGVYLAK